MRKISDARNLLGNAHIKRTLMLAKLWNLLAGFSKVLQAVMNYYDIYIAHYSHIRNDETMVKRCSSHFAKDKKSITLVSMQ